LSEFADLIVTGGWTISGEKIQEQTEWAQRNRHASCYLQSFSNDQGTVVCVVDLFDDRFPTMSVTNDADFVVATVFKVHGDVPIIYRDTEGQWDELRHREGYFACFRALNTRHMEEAIRTVLALHEQDAKGGRIN
jgi:hypothetical protein